MIWVYIYTAAILIPLGAFVVEALCGRWLGRLNAYLATGAIVTSFVLSLIGLVSYVSHARGILEAHHAGAAAHSEADVPVAPEGPATPVTHPNEPFRAWDAGFNWVALGAGLRAAEPALAIPLGIYIDNLAAIMFVMVTFIASLIHIYSIGYMHGDVRYPRFFTYLSLFCFSMLGLVAADNVFMVFIFWELVGICSYLLIGHWYEEKKNADAANKAFITNRIGDVGMLVGLGLLWTSLGTFNIRDINRSLADPPLRDAMGRLTRATAGEVVSVHLPGQPQPAAPGTWIVAGEMRTGDGGVPTGNWPVDDQGRIILERGAARGALERDAAHGTAAETTRTIPYWVLVVAGLGIFAGCVGKSAQFPLHVWLPDAMAGPTPVSALIHAATMVAAGVYLVGRFFPVFTAEVLLYIAYTGGITLFIAASIAMVQTDYKKVLAYSTVSQLGFMMLGLGVGGWAAGLFHLLTHAFFKALLFLGAGSVYHAVHTYEMPVLGGLRRRMPITAYTMLAATLAISGVPPFSGFYSKDAILAAALYLVRHQPEHALLFALPVVGAAMTAFYMVRLWLLTFAGESRGDPAPDAVHGHGHGHEHDAHHAGHPAKHAHESGPLMAWPLLILAVPTVIIGWPWRLSSLWVLPTGEPLLEQMLAYGEPIAAVDLGSSHLWAMGASILIATVGIGLGFLYYAPLERWRRFSPQRTAERFGGVYAFLVHKWYFDELYDAVLVRPTLRLAAAIGWFDRVVIDGLVNGSSRLTVALSWAEGLFDRFVVDWLVNLTGRAVYALGDWGRRLQTGSLRGYLMFLSAAVVVLFLGVAFWIRG